LGGVKNKKTQGGKGKKKTKLNPALGVNSPFWGDHVRIRDHPPTKIKLIDKERRKAQKQERGKKENTGGQTGSLAQVNLKGGGKGERIVRPTSAMKGWDKMKKNRGKEIRTPEIYFQGTRVIPSRKKLTEQSYLKRPIEKRKNQKKVLPKPEYHRGNQGLEQQKNQKKKSVKGVRNNLCGGPSNSPANGQSKRGKGNFPQKK